MLKHILGIDVSKEWFDVALLLGEQVVEGRFANTASGFAVLSKWLKKRKVAEVHACLEATGPYGEALAEYLHTQGHAVSVVNPLRIKRYAESQLSRTKNDRVDARLIADFCRRQEPSLWTPPPTEVRALRALVRRLEALETMRQQERNRLESAAPEVKPSLEAHVAFLDEQITSLKAQIQDHIDKHPDLQADQTLLASIKGIGTLTAAKLLGEIPEIRAFGSAPEVAAYVGLTPHQRHSGKSVRGGAHLSKLGNSAVRKALYFPALSAMRHNARLRAFAERLRQRGKPPMVIVAVVMRKLIHLAYGVLKHRQPFDPAHTPIKAVP